MTKEFPLKSHRMDGDPTCRDSQLALHSPQPPAAVEACVHQLIDKHCDRDPEAPAVCAWDGDFTYQQLMTLASSLGELLSAQGVGLEVFVPIYFEKSRWTVVAMLGVLYAGGAFVLLEPSFPIKRLEWICQTAKASLVIASRQNAEKARGLAPEVVVIDDSAELKYKGTGHGKAAGSAAPNNAAYAIFTSGTTGTPKGVVIEHRSISSSCVAHGLALWLTRSSRALQFSSYAFDACLLEMLTVLVHGGCVCIPSEKERRSDLVGAVSRLRVNWAVFTPSVARPLDPMAFPTLETVVCVGEAVTKPDIDHWTPHVNLLNCYGPAECTIVACAAHIRGAMPIKVGNAAGCRGWVVDENDAEVLRPVGQIGELLIDGPIVGRGYIGTKSHMEAGFVNRPGWLKALSPHTTGKVYKTGDLARCHEDGSFEVLGRKDTQLKVHGQRMEAAEIEYHLRQHISVRDLAVDIVQPKDDSESALLAAFLVLKPGETNSVRDINSEPHLTAPPGDLRTHVEEAIPKLRRILPGYMIPSAFLTLSRMPLSTSGKLDRRSLRQIGSSRTRRELQQSHLEPAAMISPRTATEEILQRLWAAVLRIPPQTIGIEDSFWTLGGNSIRAMKLAGLARHQGYILDIHDIWSPSTLEEMAASLRKGHTLPQEARAFSLCEDKSVRADLVRSLGENGIDRSQIQDIYPCTRLQEGLFALTVKRPGAYTVCLEFKLPLDVDIVRFCRAWEIAVEANPILRTRIIQDNAAVLWQAVIRDKIPWDTRNPDDDVPREWRDWKLGQRLVRLALSRPASPHTPHLFTLVIHHSLIDGWGLELILQQVDAAYNGRTLDERPFRPFVQYVLSRNQDETERHWRQRLAGLNAAPYPKLPSADYVPRPSVTIRHTIPIPSTHGLGRTTVPNQIMLAWGILISYYTDNWDVLFGLTVAGRGAAVQGIETMTGPAIASIPMRLLLDPRTTVEGSLRSIQTVMVDNMPFEQIGLQSFSRLGAGHAIANQFQTHLVIQPDTSEYPRPPLFSSCRDRTKPVDVSSYAISLNVSPSTTSVRLEVTFDPIVIGETQMKRMIHQFHHIFQQVQKAPEAELQDIQGPSPYDIADLRRWNLLPPAPIEKCAHGLIYQRTIAHPDAPAVHAWDGQFTYHELDLHAEQLARRLVALGVGPEKFVPLCFEKSCWTSVAMLGVLKAGGAFALLEPNHPIERLQQICREIHGPVVLCSESTAATAMKLGPSEVVIVDPNGTQWKEHTAAPEFTSATPENAISHPYAFDVSVIDSLLTLVAGGCVCIPSEEDRKSDLAGAVARLHANWAMITPSVARILSPQTAPSLKTLVCTGEPMNAADVELWSPHLHLMNGYGPAECAVLVTLKRNVQDGTQTANIGTPQGVAGWIVDPQNPRRLSPIGAVGELLVEGPIIAREYLNEPQKTSEAFLNSPPWLGMFRDTPCRLYRTGDLVKYTSEGAFVLLGRKDTQIKVHGQRVEIGEVEYHLQRCFPDAHAVVADLITPQDGRDALLAGFVCLRAPSDGEQSIFAESDDSFHQAAAIALAQLSSALPSYMIPAVLIPVNCLPFSATGKLDRRALAMKCGLLSPAQLDAYRAGERFSIREPQTRTQRDLQRLFGDALSLSHRQIGIDDHFFRLGGDSVSVLKLVSLARKAGYPLTASHVFTSPRIVDLAEKIGVEDGPVAEDETLPFSLSPGPQEQSMVIAPLLGEGRLSGDQIEDLYPCTPMQEGLMALSLRDPGKYIARYEYDLAEEVDLDRFREAFDRTVAANPILRTRFAQGASDSFQVVIRELPKWEKYGTQEEYEIHSRIPRMGPNECLLQPILIASPARFVLTIHHALYDAESLHLVWEQIEAVYRGQKLQPRPFSAFIRYLKQEKGSIGFWRAQFKDLNGAVFPALPSAAYNPTPNQAVHHRISLKPASQMDISITAAIQLAWALILSYYTDCNDVVYGLVLSGRNAPVRGIEEFTGPTVTTVPFRICFDLSRSAEEEVARIQTQMVAMMAHEQTGLQTIRSISDDTARACEFQNQVIIQPPTSFQTGGLATGFRSGGPEYSDFASYGIVLVCNLAAERHRPLEIIAQYDPHMLEEQKARRMVVQFEHILQQIVSQPNMPLRDISAVSPSDWQQLAHWNATLPPSRGRCLHDLVLERCASQPDAQAVSAWDGDLTFRELASLSCYLARVLRDQGLQEGCVVPVCLERSGWSILTLMAVLCAGASLVCIDHGFPVERVQQIVDQVQPQVVIASKHTKDKFQGCSATILIAPFIPEASAPRETFGPVISVEPSAPAFILFTSGSTGQPKGIVIEHRHISTSIRDHSGPTMVTRNSRVLHFTSYAFDVMIWEIFTTLVMGACVCVPSEEDRMNALESFIAERRVNQAFFTPSMLAILDPERVPSLKTVVAGGEVMTRHVASLWGSRVVLLNGYGPAEICLCCAVGRVSADNWEPGMIGPIHGGSGWVTVPSDPTRLAPLGAVGELIIEGPSVTRGYLNNPDLTRAAFIDPPDWLIRWRKGKQPGRLYRTGDLVEYTAEGNIRFIGRKDSQVKLRGQRLELEEVEYHVHRCTGKSSVVVDVAEMNGSTVLFACIVQKEEGKTQGMFQQSLLQEMVPGSESFIGEPGESFRQAINAAIAELDRVLPSFMVPSVFVPLRHIPLNRSGKVDRGALRDAVAALPDAFLDACTASFLDTTEHPPATPAERSFQRLFADLFGRDDATAIRNTDHFFRLGGDSIRAMSLIPKAREEGYAITMSDVFTHPRLCDLAKAARPIKGDAQGSVMPFTLIPDSSDMVQIAARHCRVPPSQIQDMYPCTSLQEGLMALSAKSPDRYVVTFRYELDARVDLDRFQSAWTATTMANPILRTRMVQSDHHPGTFQVVLADSPRFHNFADWEEHDMYTRAQGWGLGDHLVQLALVRPRNCAVQFHLTLHHALYDGWTIPALWRQVTARYRDPSCVLPLCPFNRFINYVQQQTNAAAEYWRAEFSGIRASIWPALPSVRRAPASHSSLHRTAAVPDSAGGSEYTTTTLIHLAWALVMSAHTDSDDVTFGVTLNGRSAPLSGIEEMAGPTIATFPLRVRLGLDCDTVEEALSTIQRQAAKRMPFEQFGLQNIRHVSDEAAQACQFQCHLGVQLFSSSTEEATDLSIPITTGYENLAAFAEYTFVIICHLDRTGPSTVTVEVNYVEAEVSSAMARRMLGQFSHLLDQLPRNLRTPLNQLDLICQEDRRQLLEWNSRLPPSFDVCVHDLVLGHAVSSPNATAVAAWDGELTYAQLDRVSSEVANQLRYLGVGPGSLVPVCFEKSKWAVITMLAVLRAGGGCTLIDPGHPAQYIETIISRVNANLVLTSVKTKPLIRGHSDVRVIAITAQGSAAQSEDSSWPRPSCHDTAFVIFTSGSTGEPKGILMEHSHLCTSIRDHSGPMHINSTTRALHFASYAFDASIYELFSVLSNGGCVCIPSDADRLTNLAGFMRTAAINYAIFTPSILNRLLRPEEVPNLRTVAFGGEAVTQDIVNTWSTHLTLINGYGPAEATICAVGLIDPVTWTSGRIGPVTGGVGWVTTPSDVSRLAPIGAVGELLIEGPVVTRGYLGDADRTAAAYIPPPEWLTKLRRPGNAGRLYRTGDLVQYTDDGGIRYMGRKDTQIKLHGQRIELSHVEHHVRLCFVDAAEVVAEIVMRDNGPILVAFIGDQAAQGTTESKRELLSAPDAAFREQVRAATVRLRTTLPAFMVPAIFFSLAWVPRTSSDKLDRRRLRDHVTKLSPDQVQAFSMRSSEENSIRCHPRTDLERLFQELWAAVLSTPLDEIGIDDDFFQLGGDSVQAMKLASLLRQRGFALGVSAMFAGPTIAEQARRTTRYTEHGGLGPYVPGSLLGIEDLESFASDQLKCMPSLPPSSSSSYFRPSDVQDIFPVTEFQRQFLEMQQVYYLQLTLPPEIDLKRLAPACQSMLRLHPILQSVFLPYGDAYLQMMLRHLDFELPVLQCDGDVETFIDRFCTEDAAGGIPWGTPYFRAKLVSGSSHEPVLLLRVSHAQFDGQSLTLILEDLASAFEGVLPKAIPSPSFPLYLRYRQTQANPKTYKFWAEYLQGAQMTSLRLPEPTILSDGCDSSGICVHTRGISMPRPPSGITLSSLVKAAWAVTLSQVTGDDDLVFGNVINGRDVPLEDIHALSGACVTISPMRVRIPPSKNVSDLLRHVQDQYTRAMPYANIDFDTIRKHSTPWPSTTFFSSLVTHQNDGLPTSYHVLGQEWAFKIRIIGGVPGFHVVTFPSSEGQLGVRLAVSGGKTASPALESLLDKLCSAITDLDSGLFPTLSG
ncbi:hypothetical protein BJX61DRAFT_543693 [Aspergillus egyptiacus]|nr:hypothetical protein BJX61DRAFT_543693 [Aspergillus egyptiacus]